MEDVVIQSAREGSVIDKINPTTMASHESCFFFFLMEQLQAEGLHIGQELPILLLLEFREMGWGPYTYK